MTSLTEFEITKSYTAINRLKNCTLVCSAILPETIMKLLIQEITNYIKKTTKQFNIFRNTKEINKNNILEFHKYFNIFFMQFIEKYKKGILEIYGSDVYGWSAIVMLKIMNDNSNADKNNDIIYNFTTKIMEQK